MERTIAGRSGSPAALLLHPGDDSLPHSIALLLLRVVAGGAMMLHGAPKIVAPTSWMGESAVPGLLQLLAAVAEFAGGLAWMLGLLTPVAAAGVVVTMATGILIGHVAVGDPLIRLTVTGDPSGSGAPWGGLPVWLVRADGRGAPGSGSSELALLYLGIGVILACVGAGRFSLDRVLTRRRSER
ncbi:DoxX family protein [Vulgatibacter sp.]|uniref:DoxX family protein n=1 Tax=Vulgatibacter sp. TaxID=1971226 RepID=UPI0035685015